MCVCVGHLFACQFPSFIKKSALLHGTNLHLSLTLMKFFFNLYNISASGKTEQDVSSCEMLTANSCFMVCVSCVYVTLVGAIYVMLQGMFVNKCQSHLLRGVMHCSRAWSSDVIVLWGHKVETSLPGCPGGGSTCYHSFAPPFLLLWRFPFKGKGTGGAKLQAPPPKLGHSLSGNNVPPLA